MTLDDIPIATEEIAESRRKRRVRIRGFTHEIANPRTTKQCRGAEERLGKGKDRLKHGWMEADPLSVVLEGIRTRGLPSKGRKRR